jgi:putative transposase
VEEFLSIRGVEACHATVQKWVFKITPLIQGTFRKKKKPVENSWRMDEMYIKVKGGWMYLYRLS